jgi:mRNA-degrading endonuclease RelE of RelBE toxin-antitoxin system
VIKVEATPKFIRLAKKSMTPEALQKLIDSLVLCPEQCALIKGTGGIRKIRWDTGKGSGKRGGLRIIYYYDSEQLILLVTLYKKADQENLNSGEKAELRKLISELFGD